ncbi:MAG: nitrilase-related carbon-nitrogen hydrolase [Thermoanaerobaculia bacterium]
MTEHSERRSKIKVGLAQIDCRLADLEHNLAHHLEWIATARAEGVELLLFPELSLTGYRLLHLTPRVALQTGSSPLLRTLREAAPEIAIVVGCVEEDEKGALYNSAILLHGGEVTHVHRKLYLPTYGIFQEGRFFSEGRRLGLTTLFGNPFGVLICEDFWHSDPAEKLARHGAKLIGVISASPGSVGSEPMPPSQEAWESLTRASALLNHPRGSSTAAGSAGKRARSTPAAATSTSGRAASCRPRALSRGASAHRGIPISPRGRPSALAPADPRRRTRRASRPG